MKRMRAVVTGHVQGVFFRDSCRRQALARNLSGWVRNNADGSVEAVLEGDDAQVDALVDWLHRGPPDARVESVDAHSETSEGLTGFRIV